VLNTTFDLMILAIQQALDSGPACRLAKSTTLGIGRCSVQKHRLAGFVRICGV
jgi:hypothetical protein